jgi:molybdate transport system substrate-binding protein
VNGLNMLSGGAAHGLVASVSAKFRELTGFEIAGDFGAVGSMADKLRNGTPTDLVILTRPLMNKLAQENWVVPGSMADIGMVETAIAVRAGDPKPRIENAAEFRHALLSADEICVPDMVSSTAGIHISKILHQLGIADQLTVRLKMYPNGATAMRHLASSEAFRPIGCTQSTEIISTPGVELSGSLPPGCELATMYTAAVATRTANARQAGALIELLTGADQRELRRRAGFI